MSVGAKRVNLKAIKSLFERCWTAVSKLESQVTRTPTLPQVYKQHVADAFESLNALNDAVRDMKGPWRVSGETEDGRMITVSNSEGFVVAHVHDFETAKTLVAMSQLG